MHRPIDARRHGIEIVHQDLALCDNLTAAANVFLGREMRRGVGPFKILDYAAMYRRAGEIFAELQVGDPAARSGASRCPAASARPLPSRAPGLPMPRSC